MTSVFFRRLQRGGMMLGDCHELDLFGKRGWDLLGADMDSRRMMLSLPPGARLFRRGELDSSPVDALVTVES